MQWKRQPELGIQLLKSLSGLHPTLAKAEAPTVLWNLCDEALSLAFLNLNSPFSYTDHVPIILASLFFPHHANCTRDEDGDVCIDHWGFICLDPGCLWTSFTLLLFWGGGLQLNIIYIYHSDTPPSIIFICIFFYLFLAALMIKPIVLHKWSNTEFHPQPFPVFFFPESFFP